MTAQPYALIDASGMVADVIMADAKFAEQTGKQMQPIGASGASIGWTFSKGAFVAPPVAAAPEPTLAEAQATQSTLVLVAARTALAQVVSAYPDTEVSTWPQQLAEATAYTASKTATTPMLSAIAMASGETVAALAAKVLARSAAYQAAAGAVIGKRIALMTQIAAATTIAAVQAIVW